MQPDAGHKNNLNFNQVYMTAKHKGLNNLLVPEIIYISRTSFLSQKEFNLSPITFYLSFIH